MSDITEYEVELQASQKLYSPTTSPSQETSGGAYITDSEVPADSAEPGASVVQKRSPHEQAGENLTSSPSGPRLEKLNSEQRDLLINVDIDKIVTAPNSPVTSDGFSVGEEVMVNNLGSWEVGTITGMVNDTFKIKFANESLGFNGTAIVTDSKLRKLK